MKSFYQNIAFLLLGLLFGLTIRIYFENFSTVTSWQLPIKIFSENISLAQRLYNETRVLCWVMTSPENHLKRAVHVKETWGKRCNRLIFMSTQTDDKLDTIALNVKEGHDHLWPKTREAFKYVYDHYFNEADWFLKTDDDTYVVMENLRAFLYSFSSDASVYFGYKYQYNIAIKQGYMAGGAYVLSKEALHRFATQAYGNESLCHYKYPAEDLQMGVCLANVGVVAGDSRDKYGRNRFFPVQFWGYKRAMLPQWYWKYQFYEEKNKTDVFSDSAIAFHYTPWYDMYFIEYLLYKMRPFGIEQRHELPFKKNMEYLMKKWHLDRAVFTDNIKLD